MNYGESGLSASDVLALTNTRSGSSNDGWGDNGAWWMNLFLIFGWGRNGFGGRFGNGSGVGENYVLATDFATVERKLDNISNGICDSTFALNNTINNGFFGVQNALCQGFNGLNVAYLQGTNSLASQLASCCCDIRAELANGFCTIGRGIDGINYNTAMNTNAIQQTLCNNTRDIIENANANYRAIHEELVANKLEAKNDRIAELQAQVSKLQLAASQEKQNNYLTATMDANVAEILRRTGNDCPVPAYVVNGPTPINFPTNCCNQFAGFNNGCGCGSY